MSTTTQIENTYARDFVNCMRADMEDIKRAFFKIGFRLYEAQKNAYYQDLGFNSLVECSEALFGFSKTTTYELIEVYKKFRDGPGTMFLPEKYAEYSQSQLVAISKLKYGISLFMERAKPTDTVATLKEAVKRYNKAWIHGSSKDLPQNGESLDAYIDRMDSKKLDLKNAIEDAEKDIEISEYTESSAEGLAIPDKASFVSSLMYSIIKQLSYKLEECEDDIKIVFVDSGEPVDYPGFTEAVMIDLLQSIVELGQAVKSSLRDLIDGFLNRYDYEIKLHGRKQPSKGFAGSLATDILRSVSTELSNLRGESNEA